MDDKWLGFAPEPSRGQVLSALRGINKSASVSFVRDPAELRSMAARYGLPVILGFADEGVSDVNLAAAIAHDGSSPRVVLVCRNASGSLKSRAHQAGVSEVLDVALSSEAAPVAGAHEKAGEVPPRAPATGAAERGASGPVLRPSSLPVGGVVDEVPFSLSVPKEIASVPAVRVPKRPVSPPGKERAPLLTFVSGRGGVGKTTLVATAAAIASSWGMKVSLCDLDLSCGNLYSRFGLAGPADLSQLGGVQEDVAKTVDLLGVSAMDSVRLWGSCDRPEMAEVVMPEVGTLLGELAATSDLVLVDTSPTFTDAVAQSAQMCDRLLLVTDGGVGSAVALARLGSLAVRLGVARTRIVRISNRCDPKGRDDIEFSRADVGLETARNFRVVDGGEEVGELAAAGKIPALAEMEGDFVTSLASALAQVLAEMGRLPDCEAAAKACEASKPRKRWAFGKRKEAV
jgi:pilus assembly protein CpaE